MNTTLFESLLLEGESPTLEFKRDQYPFDVAGKNDRAELVKDILHMTNVPKRSDAYILIGVANDKTLVGVTQDLNDHTLQSFFASKTNHAIRFHYEPFEHNGKKFGVIKIDQHQISTTIYLKEDFAFLRATAVYLRKGTCNDHTKPASPEEIQTLHNQPTEAPAVRETPKFEIEAMVESGYNHQLKIANAIGRQCPTAFIKGQLRLWNKGNVTARNMHVEILVQKDFKLRNGGNAVDRLVSADSGGKFNLLGVLHPDQRTTLCDYAWEGLGLETQGESEWEFPHEQVVVYVYIFCDDTPVTEIRIHFNQDQIKRSATESFSPVVKLSSV